MIGINTGLHMDVLSRFCLMLLFTGLHDMWCVFGLLLKINTYFTKCFYAPGDIKCENLMVTSWNWIFLTDFSPFKPTFLPEDNPADYSFYFESARSGCYLAPERFYRHTEVQYKQFAYVT